MTAAGISTATFIAIVAAIYIAWTAIAYRQWRRPTPDSFNVMLIWWCLGHFLLAGFLLAAVLGGLGRVAGWWS